MKSRIVRLFVTLLCLVPTTDPALASGTIPWASGIYEMTFVGDPWTTYADTDIDDYPGFGRALNNSTDTGLWETIDTVANYSGGGGGNGVRHWLSDNGDGSQTAGGSGGVTITFGGVSRVYMRWVQRHQAGTPIALLYDWKLCYLYGTNGESAYLDRTGGGLRLYDRNSAPYAFVTPFDIDDLWHAAGPGAAASDQTAFQMQLMLDFSLGTMEIWALAANGTEYHAQFTGIQWRFTSLAYMTWPSNQKAAEDVLSGWTPDNAWVDYDDFAFSSNYGGATPSQRAWLGGGAPPDTSAPTAAVTDPAASPFDNGTAATVDLEGTAADNVAVTSVTGSCPTCTPSSWTATGTTSWQQLGLGLSDGDNVVTVLSHDAAGNASAPVLRTIVRQATPDSQAPTLSGLSPVGTLTAASDPQAVTLAVATDEACTCKYDAANVAYSAMAGTFGTTGAMFHQHVLSLSAGAGYTYHVRCRDGAGNDGYATNTFSLTEPQAQILYADNWESGTRSAAWNCDGTSAGASTISATDPIAGIYSLIMQSSDPGDWVYCANSQDEIVVTETILLDPTYTAPTTGVKLWNLAIFESWAANYIYAEGYDYKPQKWAPAYLNINLNASNQIIFDYTRADGLPGGVGTPSGILWDPLAQNQGTPVTHTPGVPYVIKWQIRLNTPGESDGICRLWIDGVLKAEHTTVNFRDSYTANGLNRLAFLWYPNPSHPHAQWCRRDGLTIAANESIAPAASGKTEMNISGPGTVTINVSGSGRITFQPAQ